MRIPNNCALLLQRCAQSVPRLCGTVPGLRLRRPESHQREPRACLDSAETCPERACVNQSAPGVRQECAQNMPEHARIAAVRAGMRPESAQSLPEHARSAHARAGMRPECAKRLKRAFRSAPAGVRLREPECARNAPRVCPELAVSRPDRACASRNAPRGRQYV